MSHTPSRSTSAPDGQASQRSPMPSPSLSAWPSLNTAGQLSQASPNPSWSLSVWRGLGMRRQLSIVSITPSPSVSVPVGGGGGGGVAQVPPTQQCDPKSDEGTNEPPEQVWLDEQPVPE